MSNEQNSRRAREVVGVFLDGAKLRAAIDDLATGGFENDRIALLASEHAVESSLGELYTRTNENPDASKAPVTAFVEADSVGDTVRSAGGGLYFAGSTAALGAAVVSAAAFGGALLPAVAGVAAVGAVGALIGSVISRSDAEYFEHQLEKGRLLLFVRIDDPAGEEEASKILSRHAAEDVRVHEYYLKPPGG
jgi:hypothetical protein